MVNAVQHTISIYNFTIYNLLFGCAIYAAWYDLQFYNLLFTIYHVQCTICHVAYIAQPNSK
ncbi:putative membrane protein [Bacteroides uniformis str. 3978 T3 i]|uniref:Putative membrane protein n=1 Tax=Bacteroides uniformis str. 3978 T3 ii TaxID=1339349 RepID=A0A078S0U2_BACUN|nr:putative membrane protein [Bacteroides uniformis str. 3978 T3 ii]KDS61430.1 putative membrane protein [Bacteroides uniformis str. 3978 T3 i]